MHNSLRIENLNWYVLYTSPRAEKQVRNRISLLDVECWLPLHRTPRVWSDRVKLVDVPLFNSYVFVRCTPGQLYPLLKVSGVVRIILYDGKPAIVRQEEIEAIKDFIEQSAGYPLILGEDVDILAGIMKRISGKLRRIKKTYLVLYLEQLGATVCVNPAKVAPSRRIK